MAETDNQAETTPDAPLAAAGTVITPDNAPAPSPLTQPASSPPAAPAISLPRPQAVPPEPVAPPPAPVIPVTPVAAVPTAAPEAPAAPAPAQPASQTGEATGFYHGDEGQASAGGGADPAAFDRPGHTGQAERVDQSVSWTASEFVAHEKSSSWYVGLAVVGLIITVLIYLVTRDKISTAVIVVGVILLGIYGGRQPRQLQYQVDGRGLTIGQKHYGYDQFRSFSLTAEGTFPGIVFMPLKRFALPTTIYYAPDDEDKIVDLLADQLPLDSENYHDAVDSLMRRLRF